MTQETITVENLDEKTIEIIKEHISSINGKIKTVIVGEISWEFEYRKQIIKCKTTVSSSINKIKIKTTANHKKGNKSYEKFVINKLHSLLKEKTIIPEGIEEESAQKEYSEKISYKTWVWFVGVLLLLFIGGNLLKNVNLKSKDDPNQYNDEDTIIYNSYEEYETIEIPDSVYENLKVEYGQKNVEKLNSSEVNRFSQFSGKKVTFKSTYYDKEKNNIILNTNHEITYHTIDFNRRIVTQKSQLNGRWIEYKYPINGFYEEGLTNVIIVNDLGVKEIWFSPTMLNLGYDYMDGSRIACYGLSVEN